MDNVSITADQPTTRAEIEAAIVEHNRTLSRMPAHWADRRASLHDKINALLDQRDQATA